jgi:hypothetical protein
MFTTDHHLFSSLAGSWELVSNEKAYAVFINFLNNCTIKNHNSIYKECFRINNKIKKNVLPLKIELSRNGKIMRFFYFNSNTFEYYKFKFINENRFKIYSMSENGEKNFYEFLKNEKS